MPFATIPEALHDIRAGKMVVVVDDEDRENEGDLTIAAEKVTPEIINFMARHGRGLICLPMTGERLDELRIPLMVQDEENSARFGTAFCVPIEAKQGTTTGISAADRARTVLAARREEDLRIHTLMSVALSHRYNGTVQLFAINVAWYGLAVGLHFLAASDPRAFLDLGLLQLLAFWYGAIVEEIGRAHV